MKAHVVHGIGGGIFRDFPQAKTHEGHLLARSKLDGRLRHGVLVLNDTGRSKGKKVDPRL